MNGGFSAESVLKAIYNMNRRKGLTPNDWIEAAEEVQRMWRGESRRERDAPLGATLSRAETIHI
jgi:hypothetical protein